MTEVTNPSPKFFGQTWAIRIGTALLLGYAMVTGYAIHAKKHLASIEHAVAPTAVGDRNYFPLQRPADPSRPLARLGGHDLYFVDWKAAADASMIEAGMDDSNSHAVYKLEGAAGGEAAFLYLKTEPNLYAKVKMQ